MTQAIFAKDLSPTWKKLKSKRGQKKKTKKSLKSLRNNDCVVYYHQSGYKFYERSICKNRKPEFPCLVSYNRFVELMYNILILLTLFMKVGVEKVVALLLLIPHRCAFAITYGFRVTKRFKVKHKEENPQQEGLMASNCTYSLRMMEKLVVGGVLKMLFVYFNCLISYRLKNSINKFQTLPISYTHNFIFPPLNISLGTNVTDTCVVGVGAALTNRVFAQTVLPREALGLFA